MNKPDWNDAPEWANYLAMDNTGIWYWHELEPEQEYGVWDNPGMTSKSSPEDNYIMAADTLEKRP